MFRTQMAREEWLLWMFEILENQVIDRNSEAPADCVVISGAILLDVQKK
ncbi:hypothetical protein AB9R81_21915 [Vibrio cyclitrophicus]|nr:MULTISPECIES: hypothetical protein [Vibrio]TCN86468.1 hypothetical protein EDB37_1010113 [Vibrio crassostreae]MCC4791004.1 hypothetical protein [Vibrio splendidus]MCF7506339.1 hypothetical protein [Vibrio sp. L3-7]CAK2398472.1 hypothetical protein VCRA2119O48_110115 [Vibrio crassostreae]CAK3908015.1 hypothetical protein VCRA212O16_330056 [Vibrio crassostreae]